MAVGTSVIIPVTNGSNFLAEALGSALAELSPADEVLVVWDDSDDAMTSVLRGFKDPRIRVIKGLGHGVAGRRNAGLAAALGDFIAFLDHDDLWPPHRHRKMQQMMIDNPNVGAVFGRMRNSARPRRHSVAMGARPRRSSRSRAESRDRPIPQQHFAAGRRI